MPSNLKNFNVKAGLSVGPQFINVIDVNGAATFNSVTTGNLSSASSITITGNLLPNANVTYDLGSPTQRWNTLYLSNNTIYLGDVPLSTGDNNQLTVGNVAVATFSNGVIDGTSTAANVAYSVSGANVIGTVDSANTASTVTTNAQSNITSLGTLTGLTSNGTVNFTGASNVSLGAIGNLKIAGGISSQILSTDGVGNLSWTNPGLNYKYTKEWHVDPVNGNNTTGDGSYNKPYATVAKALTSTGPGYAQVVYLHAGAYSETVTIVSPVENVEIIGVNDTGTTQFSGNWAFSHTGTSIRVRNIRFSGTVTQTSTGPVYFDDCTLTSFAKSGTGYTQFDLCDVSTTSFTSNALTMARGGTMGNLTLNNAGARVYVYNMTSVSAITVTAGIFFAFDSTLYSSTTTSNAITSSAGTIVGVYRGQITNSSGTLSRVSLAGNWTINDSTYDLGNSTLTGTNLGTVSHFDAVTVRGISALGAVANVKITGGTSGQFLQTNGSGNLTFATVNNVANATFATTADSVVNSNQSNITSLGTLTGLTVSGNATIGNVAATGFFVFPVYTASALTAITGQVGWTAAVSDSTPGGKHAYWDTTNSRWSYVSDDSAV